MNCLKLQFSIPCQECSPLVIAVLLGSMNSSPKLGLAPALRRATTTPYRPLIAATCSAVHPNEWRESTSVPSPIARKTSFVYPICAAFKRRRSTKENQTNLFIPLYFFRGQFFVGSWQSSVYMNRTLNPMTKNVY